MATESSRKDRRARYGAGLVSLYYIETGEPLQEKLTRDAQRDKAIRAQVIAEERRADSKPKRNKKKRRREKQREAMGYHIYIDEVC